MKDPTNPKQNEITHYTKAPVEMLNVSSQKINFYEVTEEGSAFPMVGLCETDSSIIKIFLNNKNKADNINTTFKNNIKIVRLGVIIDELQVSKNSLL